MLLGLAYVAAMGLLLQAIAVPTKVLCVQVGGVPIALADPRRNFAELFLGS